MRIRDIYSVENVSFNLRLCKHNLMQKTTLLQQSTLPHVVNVAYDR